MDCDPYDEAVYLEYWERDFSERARTSWESKEEYLALMKQGHLDREDFGRRYAAAPFCAVTPGSAASTTLVTTTISQMNVTFGTANTAFYYHCFGA